MSHRIYSHRPIWFKATHALLVCLVVLAAARSLIPGLCATLSAAQDSAKARQAVPACCAARLAEEESQPAFRGLNLAKEHAPCALCYLVMGLGHSAPCPAAVLAVEPAVDAPFVDHGTPCAVELARANASRAPPAIA